MNTINKILGGLTLASIGVAIHTIHDHKTVNHADAYASEEVPDELRKDGITAAKDKLNRKNTIINNTNFKTRVKLHDCIGSALADCSQNLKAAATEGLEQCTTRNYKLDRADLECIQDERRQEALKACAQLVEISQ